MGGGLVAAAGLAVAVVNVVLTLFIWWDVRATRARLGRGDGGLGDGGPEGPERAARR